MPVLYPNTWEYESMLRKRFGEAHVCARIRTDAGWMACLLHFPSLYCKQETNIYFQRMLLSEICQASRLAPIQCDVFGLVPCSPSLQDQFPQAVNANASSRQHH